MKRVPLFIDSAGTRRPLKLGERLGRGGEANVYEVAGSSDLAAKLWLEPAPAQQAKLAAMLRTVPDDPAAGSGHHALMRHQATESDQDGRTDCFDMPRLLSPKARSNA